MSGRVVPRLHLVGPLGMLSQERYIDVAAAAVKGGVDAVHVRLLGEPGGVVYGLATKLAGELNGTYAALVVNDRADVATLLELHVQLGEQSLSTQHVRRLVGNGAFIGRSVHDLDGACRAAADGADYLLAGHVFDTDSKAGQPGRGLPWLAALCAGVDAPVIAIGGITAERIPAVISAGAYGVAVGRELLLADDPMATAATLRRLIERTMQMSSSTSTNITIQLNGSDVSCQSGTTLGALLDGRGVERRMIAVEYNGEIVPRYEYDSTVLSEGDRLEVVQMVGGG